MQKTSVHEFAIRPAAVPTRHASAHAKSFPRSHSMTTSTEYIAGGRTCADWQAFRRTLTADTATPDDWSRAYHDYFRERLDLRYLNPIRVLQDNGTYQGEGFAIAAIQCSLV